MTPVCGEWEIPAGYQFWHTIRFLRMGQRDPSVQRESDHIRIARWFHSGAATVELRVHGGTLTARAWGPGAHEAMEAVPNWAGLHDVPCRDFGCVSLNRTLHPVLGTHLSRAPFVSHEVLPNILQQQIAWRDAARIWYALLAEVGEVAPGPFDLTLPPTFEQMRRTPHGFLQQIGLSEPRIRAIREVGRLGHRLDEWLAHSKERFVARITSLPSIGPWTANHVLAVSMGEPDVLVTGDYTIPHTVCWVLAREARGTDERMRELLAPFTGNRWRVVRLMWARNLHAPRRGARMSGLRKRSGFAGPRR